MKITIITILLFFVSYLGQSQNVSRIVVEDIPVSIKVKGKFVEGYKWLDKNGSNILILSKKGPFQESESIHVDYPERSVYLYAEQYIINNDSIKLLWDIIDFEKNCPFDIEGSFIDNSTSITDLDKDGITETTIVYKLACRSDTSPASMKVLMHENNIKYGLRGTMVLRYDTYFNKIDFDNFEFDLSKVKESNDKDDFLYRDNARYNNEDDFKNAPPEFLIYAKKKWRENVVEY